MTGDEFTAQPNDGTTYVYIGPRDWRVKIQHDSSGYYYTAPQSNPIWFTNWQSMMSYAIVSVLIVPDEYAVLFTLREK